MSLTFLAPQFLWALLALPVILLLHFIRARRKRREVSALFLWKEAKQLSEARRRFSPTWLLALQLAFATLAALALSQPRLSLAGPPERVIIVDASASMAAEDSDGVRLEKAKRRATPLVRGASRVAVIRAGLDATVVQPLSSDRAAVERALATVEAFDREADLERAVALARAIAPEAELHLFTDDFTDDFTDGAPPSDPRLALHPVGGDALNVGVTTFDIGLQQAFVTLASNHPRPQEVALELFQDGALVAQSTLLVPAQGRANITFPLSEGTGFFEARVDAPEWDALALDDRAFAGTRPLRLALSGDDEAVLRALDAIPNLDYQVLPGAAPEAPGFDARVIVGLPPETLPAGNFLFFAPPSDDPDYQLIRDWDQSDPLLRFVSLADTVVGLDPDAPRLEGDWRVLARTGDLRPVLLHHQSADTDAVVAAFHPTQTDMVNRSAFPLLIANVVTGFRDEERLPTGALLPQGSALVEGERQEPRSRASAPGLYSVAGERVAVSLLNAGETRLSAAEPLPEASEAPAAATSSEQVWSAALWLVGLAAAALLAEWLLFARGRAPRWFSRRRA